MGGSALQLADELADEQRRRNGDAQVHVIVDAADFVDENPQCAGPIFSFGC
jgi:hypothetical protein